MYLFYCMPVTEFVDQHRPSLFIHMQFWTCPGSGSCVWISILTNWRKEWWLWFENQGANYLGSTSISDFTSTSNHHSHPPISSLHFLLKLPRWGLYDLGLDFTPVSSTASLSLHQHQLCFSVAQVWSVIPCPSPSLDPTFNHPSP